MLYRIKARATIYVEIEGAEEQIDAALDRVAGGEDCAFDDLINAALDIDAEPTSIRPGVAIPRFTIHPRIGLMRAPKGD